MKQIKKRSMENIIEDYKKNIIMTMENKLQMKLDLANRHIDCLHQYCVKYLNVDQLKEIKKAEQNYKKCIKYIEIGCK